MEEREKAWEMEKWLVPSLMQRVSSFANACSKICRANPSAINRCQRSTALDTEQDQQRDRRLPISPVLLLFRPASHRKSRHIAPSSERAPFLRSYSIANARPDTSCFQTEIFCLEIARGTTNGTAAPAINIFRVIAFCRPIRWQVDSELSERAFLRRHKCFLSCWSEPGVCPIEDKKEIWEKTRKLSFTYGYSRCLSHLNYNICLACSVNNVESE